jgi:PAS domain S-box-containing protein
MSFDTFKTELTIVDKFETLLNRPLTDQDCREALDDLLFNYKKLLKFSRRIVRMSDLSEKSLISARNQIQDQQTSLEKAHQELKLTSEHRLRTIVEATPIAIFISQIDNDKIIYANEVAGPLMGVATKNLINCDISEFYVDALEKQILLDKLSVDGRVDHYELRINKKDNSTLWVDVSQRYLVFNERPCILSSFNDITHLKEMNLAASRFVPVEYLSFLKKESLVDVKLGDHVTDEMTVMFTDLRSFTSISEDMTPQQNFNFVNSYLGRVSPVVRDYRGFIVKYLGDGIMAIFPKCADDGVQAGIEKLNQINLYNEKRLKKGNKAIKVGIGINTGYMMVGMVGEAGRMQGDAFSDNVNLTSRLEGLTKFYDVSIIISAATKAALIDQSKYNIRYLDKVKLKGKIKELDIYEVFDSDPPDSRSLKLETLELYHQAMELYAARDFTATQSLLLKVLQINPNDKVVWHHLMNTTRNIEVGVPQAWTGVNVMTSK